MLLSLNTVRTVGFALICSLLAACSQTGISSYQGSLGKKSLSQEDIRHNKIKAARERARILKAKRKAEFKEKRLARIEAKKKARAARKKVKSRSQKTTSKAASRKLKKSTRTAKTSSKKRHLKSKKAFVPNVSRKAGKIRVNAPWKCVPKRLKQVILDVRRRYGPVTINSTRRSKSRNRMVGGKKRSYHLRCAAVDFRVHGKTRGLTRYLARHPLVGGYKRYPSGFYHIDTGPKRTW